MTRSFLLLLPLGATLALGACTTLGGPGGDGSASPDDDVCDDAVECETTSGTAGGVDTLSADFRNEAGITSDADPVGQPADLVPACGNLPDAPLLVGSDFAFAPTRGYVSAGHVAALLLGPEPVLPDPQVIRTADFVNMYGAPVTAQSKAHVSVVSMRKSPDSRDDSQVLVDVETSVPIPADARPPTNAVVLFAESASLLGSDHDDAFGVQKDVVRSLVAGFLPTDRVWLAGWGAGFRVALQDSAPDKVEAALASFSKPSSSGKLETAVENGVALLRQDGNQGHVFVLFDGTVPTSRRLDDVLQSAREDGVLVHALVVNESGYFDRVGVERIERAGGTSLFLSSRSRSSERVFGILAERSDELFGRAYSGVQGTLFHPDTFVPVLPDSPKNGVGEPAPVGPGRFVTARHVFSGPAASACNATFALSYAFDKAFQASELPTANALYNPATTNEDEVTLVTMTRTEAIQRVVAFLKVARTVKPEIALRFAQDADFGLASVEHDARLDELNQIFCAAAALAGVGELQTCPADAAP